MSSLLTPITFYKSWKLFYIQRLITDYEKTRRDGSWKFDQTS